MQNKIDIPGTTITLEIVDKTITITNKIEYDMQMHFRNADADTSLDASGDVFEPLYWLDIKATPKVPTEYHTSLGIKREKRPIVIYKADNKGAEIFGKVVEKSRHGKLYTLTIRDYGMFVVTKDVYEKVKVGDEVRL